MRKLSTLFFLVLMGITGFCQVPGGISYQAVIRDAQGTLVTESQVGMQISILQGTTTGGAVYVETHWPEANANGLVNIEIGAGTVISGSFENINWAGGPYFIKTEIDAAGSNSWNISGTSQLLSVPYAMYARTAENVIGGGDGGFNRYIGQLYGGGVVFHIWKDHQGVERALVVALTDQSIDAFYSNITNVEIGKSAQSSWNGKDNTSAIVAQNGHTESAASLAMAHDGGDFDDWYLPSAQELSMLWNNLFNINQTLSETPGATEIENNTYWSSTEYNNSAARAVDFSTGMFRGFNFLFGYGKSSPSFVRAIRAL